MIYDEEAAHKSNIIICVVSRTIQFKIITLIVTHVGDRFEMLIRGFVREKSVTLCYELNRAQN